MRNQIRFHANLLYFKATLMRVVNKNSVISKRKWNLERNCEFYGHFKERIEFGEKLLILWSFQKESRVW